MTDFTPARLAELKAVAEATAHRRAIEGGADLVPA